MIAAFEGGLALLAAVIGGFIGIDPLAAVKWSPGAIGWGLLGSLPLIGMLLVTVWIRWEPLRRVADTVDEVLCRFFRHAGWIDVAAISFLAGLGEEMLFRGVLQAGLAEWIGGTPGAFAGLALGAVVFGAAHAVHRPYFVVATMMGLYFGGLFLHFENLAVPIIVHAVYDFVAILYLRHRLFSRNAPKADPPSE